MGVYPTEIITAQPHLARATISLRSVFPPVSIVVGWACSHAIVAPASEHSPSGVTEAGAATLRP